MSAESLHISVWLWLAQRKSWATCKDNGKNCPEKCERYNHMYMNSWMVVLRLSAACKLHGSMTKLFLFSIFHFLFYVTSCSRQAVFGPWALFALCFANSGITERKMKLNLFCSGSIQRTPLACACLLSSSKETLTFKIKYTQRNIGAVEYVDESRREWVVEREMRTTSSCAICEGKKNARMQIYNAGKIHFPLFSGTEFYKWNHVLLLVSIFLPFFGSISFDLCWVVQVLFYPIKFHICFFVHIQYYIYFVPWNQFELYICI